MKKKKARKKYDYRKSAVKMLNGAVMSWSVHDPLGDDPEVLNPKFSHKNPILKLVENDIKGIIKPSIETLPMLWSVKIEVEFKSGGDTYYRGATIGIDGILSRAEDNYKGVIEGIFNESNMNQYINTHIKASILGTGSAKRGAEAA